MTSSTPTKAILIPAVLVYGKPTAPDMPQASWFRAEDRPSVAAAAQSLKFSVLDIKTEAERALTVGVHEGVGEDLRVLGGDADVFGESSYNLPQVRRLKSLHYSIAQGCYALR